MALYIPLLALLFSALICTAPAFAGPSTELTVKFQKGIPCTVRLVNDGNTDGPWLLEFIPPDGPKATLRLPLFYSNALQLEDMQAASFIAPDKQELFIRFTEVRNGIFGHAYVVDFANGAGKILFDGNWLMPGFAAQGAFADWYRIEVVFPELFDKYMLFIRDEKLADYAGFYDAQNGRLLEAREITGSYPTRFAASGPDKGGLFALEAALAVAGAASFDWLGEYSFQLRYRDGKWALHGDTHFTPVRGIQFNRFLGATPVADMHVAVTASDLERTLPPPVAWVTKVKGKSELDALAAQFGSNMVGKFSADAEDTWFFLPNQTPLTFTVWKVENMGGDSSTSDVIASYVVQAGQNFVYSGNQMVWNEETQDRRPQFIIGYLLSLTA